MVRKNKSQVTTNFLRFFKIFMIIFKTRLHQRLFIYKSITITLIVAIIIKAKVMPKTALYILHYSSYFWIQYLQLHPSHPIIVYNIFNCSCSYLFQYSTKLLNSCIKTLPSECEEYFREKISKMKELQAFTKYWDKL